jgi:sn1-specific diacylglycerol lipase
MVADDIQGFLENLIIPNNYRVVITGHSLGAGTSCLLGLLLSSRIPALQAPDKLKVVAFATPAVLNYTACKACTPFTTSVVNNSDMVPRMSISNLLTMNHGLVEVNRRLEEKGLSPDSLKKAFKYTQDLCKLDEETLMTVEELDALFIEIHENDSLTDEHDLYVPGRVVALYQCGQEAVETEATVGGIVADGSMKMLRQIELATSMIKDHFCDSYQASLDGLLKGLSSS